MGLLNSLRGLWATERQSLIDIASESGGGHDREAMVAPRSGSRTARLAPLAARGRRRLHLEELEVRRLLAGDAVPQVLLGSVYWEEANGDDSGVDIIEVSYVGGAPGTTLKHLTINGDKHQNGFTEGDVFFDTAAGGLGAFHHGGL